MSKFLNRFWWKIR